MASLRAASRVGAVIPKCRHQSTATVINAAADEALPFEEVPTFKSTKWPFVGQIPELMKVEPELYKKDGFAKGYKLMNSVRKLTGGKGIFKYYAPVMNPHGNGYVVYLFEPSMMEHVLRNEGKYPCRGPAFEFLGVLRSNRPDAFGEYTGLLSDEGEKWHDIRSKVQQDMMRPQSALYYTEMLQEVADDFVKHVELNRGADLTNHGDFLNDLSDLSLEHITAIALDTRLGCFGTTSASNPEAEKAVKASRGFASEFLSIFFGLPMWKIHPKLSSPMRRMGKHFDYFTDFSKAQIAEASRRIVEESIAKGKKAKKDMSVLEKFIDRNGADSPIPSIMASDMLLAGIETTGNTLGFLLYNLATNPNKQEKVREEMMQFGDTLSPKDVDKLKYLSACMKESQRVTPTVNGMSRILDKDIEVAGYNIPAGTWFYASFHHFAEDKKYFPDSEVYRPERWLDPIEKKSIHPFAVIPFSHGPRMCIGKRFAELEIKMTMFKLLRRFRIEWPSGEKVEPIQKLTNFPDKKLVFKFINV